MTTAPVAPPHSAAPATFEDLYQGSRGVLYQALATITDDRDLATEAIDVGFTRWRRKLRRPSGVAPDVGVMGLAYRYARKQSDDGAALSGFRLGGDEAEDSVVERFKELSSDERAILVMDHVLGWDATAISRGVGAEGIGPVARSLRSRLADEGFDESVIGDALRSRAAGFVEPLGRLDSVKAKGRLQKAGLFVGGAALAAAIVAGGVALAGSIGSSPTEPEASGAPSVTVAGGLGLTAENAVWQRVTSPVNSDNIMTLAHDGTSFYMLGSDQRGRPVMMSSENGLDWAQLPGPPTGQNMWVQHIVATSDELIVVGNGFDEVRGTESTVVFTSQDKETWIQADLPVQDQVEIDGHVYDTYTWVNSVSVTDTGFTIVGNQGAEFDPEQLLREVVDPDLFRNGWGFSDEGMEFYSDEGEIVDRKTWDELGLDPNVASLLAGGRPVLWTSTDGIDWERSTADTPPGTQGVQSYVAVDNAAGLLAWGQFGQSVWVKAGEEWVRPDVEATLTAMTSWNNKIFVAGHDNTNSEPAIWSSADGVTWERSALPVGGIQQFYTSENGIIGFGFQDAFAAVGPAEIVVGDLTVEATTTGSYRVLDAEGELLIEVFEEDVIRGNDLITINDPESGEQVVQFSRRELDNAWNLLYQELESQNPGPPAVSILISPDGVNWTVLQPEDPNFYPQSVAFGNNSALMMGWSEGEFLGFGGGQQLLLVTAGE